jgi:hypothetical protein
MGIRFIQPILDAVKEDRNTLFSLFSIFLKKVIPLQDKLAESQTFAVAYLQSEHASRAFVSMATQTSPKPKDIISPSRPAQKTPQ